MTKRERAGSRRNATHRFNEHPQPTTPVDAGPHRTGTELRTLRAGTDGVTVDWVGPVPSLNPRLHDALADLYAYVLFFDAERQRLGEPTGELARFGSGDRFEVERRRTELTEELEALRTTIAALRVHAEATGNAP